MTTRSFPVYSDPGHAWVKVSKTFLTRLLGTAWRQTFTPYSYERGDYVYLEEDDDAARLITACRSAGIEPRFTDGSTSSTESRIRSYPSLRTT